MAGRGRGHKSHSTEKTALASDGAGAPPSTTSTLPSTMSTPLGILMRVEATLWMHVCTTSRRAINDGVKGSVSVAEFHEMSRAHEWLASSPSSAVTATPPSVGDTGDAQSSAVAAAPTKEMANDVQEVERLTSQLTEEERLLFDLVASDHLHQRKEPSKKGYKPVRTFVNPKPHRIKQS